MLDANIKAQLKIYFEKIVSPITLTATLDGESCLRPNARTLK